MEGDGQVRGGGGELEGAAAADIAAQDPCRDLVAVGDGQHVTVADVQSEDGAKAREVVSDQAMMTQRGVKSTAECVGDELTSEAKC